MDLSCIGVGAGPSNLSLACQIHEEIGQGALFSDRQVDFRWHPGRAFDSSELQVSHFKDLVTLVNPRSAYTFVNYLYENGRLYHFLNAQFEAVLRAEFEQYLNWAFHRNPLVRGGETVREIRFCGEFRVWTDDAVLGARDLVVGIGKRARIPSQFQGWTGRNLFHSSDLLHIHPEVWKKDVCVVWWRPVGSRGAVAPCRPAKRAAASIDHLGLGARKLPAHRQQPVHKRVVHALLFGSFRGNERVAAQAVPAALRACFGRHFGKHVARHLSGAIPPRVSRAKPMRNHTAAELHCLALH